MADSEAPSFSLGFDLDFESIPAHDPAATDEALVQSVPDSSDDEDFNPETLIRGQVERDPAATDEALVQSVPNSSDDEDFNPETLIRDQVERDPRPVFKRLKRGLARPSSGARTQRCVPFSNIDDEIEDFSSEEGQCRGEPSFALIRSASSSSKFSLHGQRVLTTQSTKLKTKRTTLPSDNDISTFGSFDPSSSMGLFPKLTVSPLRKIQLLDSDSDDPSASTAQANDVKDVDACSKYTCLDTTKFMSKNLLKRAKIQAESCIEDSGQNKNATLETPVFDEFCEEYVRSMKGKEIGQIKNSMNAGSSKSLEEYFRPMKEKEAEQSKLKDASTSSSKPFPAGCFTSDVEESFVDSGSWENVEYHWNLPNPLPPAYLYFNHSDPRIQNLIRRRLPNFTPLSGVNHRGNQQSETAVIDYMSQFGCLPNVSPPTRVNHRGNQQSEATIINYMSQFGHQDLPTEIHEARNVGAGGSSRSRKNVRKKRNIKEASQACEGWVNPKTTASAPRDAGKQRVHANGNSCGHWYTGQDGRKVYVNKNGQELSGKVAYTQYRKESGGGFKKGRKKPTAKKRTKKQ